MRLLIRLFFWLFGILLSLVVVLIFLLSLDHGAQKVTNNRDYSDFMATKQLHSIVDSSLYEELLTTYGRNKNLAPGFEYQCLLALSYYPELKEAPIDFIIRPTFIPLSSRPAPASVLFPWLKRRFLVVISNASADFFEPILLKHLPINEQVGVIGHELAHTVYYLDKNAFQLAWIAYQYEFNGEFHNQFERDTDKRAIAHGLGYQLYDYAFFVRKSFGQTLEEIEQEEGGTYLSPREIAQEMKQYPFYRDTLTAPAHYFFE